MSIHLTTPIVLIDLKGVTTTISDVFVSDFSANKNGHVVAAISDAVTGKRVADITFLAVANVNVIKGQIETYAVSANLISGTKI